MFRRKVASLAVGLVLGVLAITTASAASVDQLAILCPPLGTIQAHAESGSGYTGFITWGYNTKTLLAQRTGHILGQSDYDPTFWLYNSGTIPSNMRATAVVCYPTTYCEFTDATCFPPLPLAPAAIVQRIATLIRQH